MAQAQVAPEGDSTTQDAGLRTGIVWEVRLGLLLRLSPLAWGGLVAALLALGAVLFRGALQASGAELASAPASLDFATRVALVASLTIGYTLAVWRWLVRAQYRELRESGQLPAAAGKAPYDATLHTLALSRLRRSRWAGLVGVLFFVCTIEGPNTLLGSGTPGAAWVHLHALSYMLGLGVLFFWIAGRAAYFSISPPALAGQVDPLAALEIDLLDRRPVRAIGRLALRSSLTWVVGISIASLAFANPELRFRESLVVFVPVLGVTLAIASAALLLPTRGVRRRLVELKRAELERVDAAIRGDRGALEGSRLARQSQSLSLADLVAYRGLVESTPEWPFDTSVVRRLSLYLLIPLASWTGGAFVERLLGLLLD